MKRFITYVYIYDKQVKQKNTGFIKVDVGDDVFKLDVRIQNIGRFSGRCPIFIMVKEENLIGIKIGELDIRKGSGNGQYVLDKGAIKNTNYTLEDVIGVRLNISDDMVLASCWREEAACIITQKIEDIEQYGENAGAKANIENMEVAGAKVNIENIGVTGTKANIENIGVTGAKANIENIGVTEAKANIENIEVAGNEESTQNTLIESINGLKRIDIADIKSLPKKNWYLCNNSFLLHGFFSYHYLVLKKVEEKGNTKIYLGVPGIYERPEKAMALLFGFPEFETENSNQQEPIGEFGYWYCLLDT